MYKFVYAVEETALNFFVGVRNAARWVVRKAEGGEYAGTFPPENTTTIENWCDAYKDWFNNKFNVSGCNPYYNYTNEPVYEIDPKSGEVSDSGQTFGELEKQAQAETGQPLVIHRYQPLATLSRTREANDTTKHAVLSTEVGMLLMYGIGILVVSGPVWLAAASSDALPGAAIGPGGKPAYRYVL